MKFHTENAIELPTKGQKNAPSGTFFRLLNKLDDMGATPATKLILLAWFGLVTIVNLVLVAPAITLFFSSVFYEGITFGWSLDAIWYGVLQNPHGLISVFVIYFLSRFLGGLIFVPTLLFLGIFVFQVCGFLERRVEC